MIFEGNRKQIFEGDRDYYLREGFGACECNHLYKFVEIRLFPANLKFLTECDYGCEKIYVIQKQDFEYIMSEYVAGREAPNFHFIRWFRLAMRYGYLHNTVLDKRNFDEYVKELSGILQKKTYILNNGKKAKFINLKI